MTIIVHGQTISDVQSVCYNGATNDRLLFVGEFQKCEGEDAICIVS